MSAGEDRRQVITLATEHPAVFETARWLGDHGFELAILPVQADGLLDLRDLDATLSERTLLVSTMLVNNEIGVIQPVREISNRCGAVGAVVHTDATQAAGRIDIDVDDLGVDLLSLSGHKIYGPKGVGALYVRGKPGLRLEPLLTGGDHERGIRPGTVPTPLIVGFGEACSVAGLQLKEDAKRLKELTERLLTELRRDFPNLRLFGSVAQRAPGNLSIGVPGIVGDRLVEAVSQKIAISTGAACATGSIEPSRVLTALGLEHEVAVTGVRIGLGRFTTNDEMQAAIGILRIALKMMIGRS